MVLLGLHLMIWSVYISPVSISLLISFLNRLIFTRFNFTSAPKVVMWRCLASSRSFLSKVLSSLRFILFRYWLLDFGCFRLICPPRLCALLKHSLHSLHWFCRSSLGTTIRTSANLFDLSLSFLLSERALESFCLLC